MDPKQDIFYKLLKITLNVYKVSGVILVITAFVMITLNISPGILYSLDSGALDADTNLLISSVEAQPANTTENSNSNSQRLSKARQLPAVDPSQPVVPTLGIPKIGVNGKVHDGSDGDSELEKGMWRDPSLGNPVNGLPIVIASHRFGYSYWSNEFRTANSFYSLPNLTAGDEIQFIWDQRVFNYRVTRIYETTSTFTANSDLILYTCRFFRSDVRVVLEAELI